MDLKVVTFHVPTLRWANSPHRYGGNRRPYTELITDFVKSIRRSSPRAEIVLLTSNDSVDIERLFDNVVYFEINDAFLMLERLRCQRSYRAQNPGPIAFLDTDVLVLRPLESIFEMNFDAAVTVRDRPRHEREIEMPYNNGVWFLKGMKRDAELTFLDHLICTNEAMHRDAYAWAGNQWAVVRTLGRRSAWERLNWFDLEVLILPCTQYNHAPESIDEKCMDRHILHFHGSYKDWMTSFAMDIEALS